MFAAIRIGVAVAAVALATAYLGLSAQDQEGPSTGAGTASAPPAGPIDWDSGRVRLRASAMRIREGDGVFTGRVPAFSVQSDGSVVPTTFEVVWPEQGTEQRMNLYFEQDGTDWWVTELRTYDGDACSPDWIVYRGPLFQTPIGEAFSGDVRLQDGLGRIRDGRQVTGSLEFDGLRLDWQALPRPLPTPRVQGTHDPTPSVTPGPQSTCDAFVFPSPSGGSGPVARPVGSSLP
jgi:hypothetical protein